MKRRSPKGGGWYAVVIDVTGTIDGWAGPMPWREAFELAERIDAARPLARTHVQRWMPSLQSHLRLEGGGVSAP